MNPNRKQYQTIDALDLSGVKKRLQKKEGFDEQRAHQAVDMYKQFLKMVVNNPLEIIVPNEDVDMAWHHHILDTEVYAKDCRNIFGKFLHHDPNFYATPAFVKACHRTQDYFEKLFGRQFTFINVNGIANVLEGTDQEAKHLNKNLDRLSAALCGGMLKEDLEAKSPALCGGMLKEDLEAKSPALCGGMLKEDMEAKSPALCGGMLKEDLDAKSPALCGGMLKEDLDAKSPALCGGMLKENLDAKSPALCGGMLKEGLNVHLLSEKPKRAAMR